MSLPTVSEGLTAFENLVQPGLDTLAATAQTISNTAEQLAADIKERLGLDSLGSADLAILGQVGLDALATLMTGLEHLTSIRGQMDAQFRVIQQELIGQPFSVASRTENVRLVMGLYITMQGVGSALQDVLVLLKAFINTFPPDGQQQLLDKLVGVNPKFEVWLAAVD